MSFGRDLVGAAGCGTANPLLSMAGSMAGMNAQLADVRGGAFAADKAAAAAGPMGAPMMGGQMMRPGGAPDAAFMNALNKPQGPAHPMGVPLHALQQQRMQQQQHMAAQRGASGAELAEQFHAMELQAKQQHEFEQAFASGGPRAAAAVHAQPPQWAMEFQQQQQHMRQQHHAGNWANEFDQMQRMGNPRVAAAAALSQQQAHGMGMHHQAPSMFGMRGPMGMMGGGMGMMGMMQQQSHFGHYGQAAASARPAVQIQEVPDSTAAGPVAEEAEAATEEAESVFGEAHDSLDEAYAAATGGAADWSAEYGGAAVPSEANQQGSVGVGGGMDKAMLDKLMNSGNPKWANSKFLKFIEKISKGEIEFRNNEAIDKGPQAASASSGGDAWSAELAAQAAAHGGNGGSADWADQFATQQAHPASWGASASASAASGSQQASGEVKSQAEQWLEDYEAQGLADTEFKDFDWQSALNRAREDQVELAKDPEYNFAPAKAAENPYASSANPYEEGVALFKAGQLVQAIAAFEAAVQRDAEHADAWSYLGECQAHNEEEHNAIAAFLKAVSIDPYNLKALLQLGISYTNDLEESRALNYLKTWLTNNPDYQSAAIVQQKQQMDQYAAMYGGGDASSGGLMSANGHPHFSYDRDLHDDVTSMFLAALSQRPDDPDLHTVLGVLYHISSDFDKAIASFKAAVALKPDDATLWNKLGATQANSSRSADAVHAYKRALQLRPTYVRTLANLAISYANQGLHDEAVRTYLTTLSHNPQASHVWSYLRISLAHMQRDDLVELSHKKDAQLFRPFFNF
jgi:peroxin-5